MRTGLLRRSFQAPESSRHSGMPSWLLGSSLSLTLLRKLRSYPHTPDLSHKIVGRDSWLFFINILSLVKYFVSLSAQDINKNEKQSRENPTLNDLMIHWNQSLFNLKSFIMNPLYFPLERLLSKYCFQIIFFVVLLLPFNTYKHFGNLTSSLNFTFKTPIPPKHAPLR